MTDKKQELIHELALQARIRLDDARRAVSNNPGEHALREAHKHIHRAQTYLWALDNARKTL